YRALKVQFSLDDDQPEALKDELIEAKRLAVDERGRVLVWVGETPPAAPPTLRSSPVAPLPDARLDHPAPQRSPRSHPPSPEAERRQLTVMFCDLVDSTSLAQQLDPEDYRAVVRAYQEATVEAIQPFDGYVGQYLGDGLLVYFGYPQAHEDAAQRAVRAGHCGRHGTAERSSGTTVRRACGGPPGPAHGDYGRGQRRQRGTPGATGHGRHPQHCSAPPGPGGPQHGGAEYRDGAPAPWCVRPGGCRGVSAQRRVRAHACLLCTRP